MQTIWISICVIASLQCAITAQSLRVGHSRETTPSNVFERALRDSETRALYLDSSLLVYAFVSRLQRNVVSLETFRGELLLAHARAIRDHADGELREIAAVIACLLGDPADHQGLELDSAGRVDREVKAVLSGRPAESEWIRDAEHTGAVVDWSKANPVGIYKIERESREILAGVFRATVYLRELGRVWRRFDPGWRARIEADEACRTSWQRLQGMNEILANLWGTAPNSEGWPSAAPVFDSADIRQIDAAPKRPDEVGLWLGQIFGAEAAGAGSTGINAGGSSVRALVLQAVTELARERDVPPLMSEVGADLWAARRLDVSLYLYCGLRECDGIFYVPVGGRDRRKDVLVFVEPVPEFYRAMERADAALSEVSAASYALEYGRQVEERPVRLFQNLIAAVASQRDGENLPDEVRNSLLNWSVNGLGIHTERGLEWQTRWGDAFRRRGAFRCEIDLMWRGEPVTAVGALVHVEQREPGGEWQWPAWGRRGIEVQKPE